MRVTRLRWNWVLGAGALVAVSLTGCGRGGEFSGPLGIDLKAMDTAVRPGDDFYEHVSGDWLEKFEIPQDYARYGVFTRLAEQSDTQVRKIVEGIKDSPSQDGSDRLARFYSAYNNTDKIETRGLSPLVPHLGQIAAISNRDDLATLMMIPGYMAPIGSWVDTDAKRPDEYVLYVTQSGLGMPDRDFYLEDGPKFVEIRTAYVNFLTTMLKFSGYDSAREMAHKVIDLETQMARRHWEVSKRRERDLTYNPMTPRQLAALVPGFPVERIFAGFGLSADQRVIIRETDAIIALFELAGAYDLDVWKAWMAAHFISNFADVLPSEIDQANFAFHDQTLRGQPQQKPRWKRGVKALNRSLGELVGRFYVERHYPPQSKQQMDELVENVRAAFKVRIEALPWMGDATKSEAQRKLQKFISKVGHPEQFETYKGLVIDADKAFENALATQRWQWQDMLSKLGQPIDRTEWFMTPQTVNAYYAPNRNEIVFPAAILQPPFFNPDADTAVNYGAIGAVIGHEMGHGFDDQGSKSDGDGVLRNWWSDTDRVAFKERTKALVEQFGKFSPIEDQYVNGQLTLGENIGDLGGLSIAYHAYRASLNGQEAPVIKGYTGDQRFFMAWAQVWRALYRDEAVLKQLRTDPHSPPRYRVNGIVRNMDAWYAAFDVKPEDRLYLPPDKRVSIW